MLSTICPLKLQKLAKKQNNLIIVSYCNLACLRRLMHFLIICKKAFAQFDSRTGPLFPTKPKYNNYQWNIRNKNEPLKIKQRLISCM